MIRERGTDLDAFLAEDGIHLTEAGNREHAEMVPAALVRILEDAGQQPRPGRPGSYRCGW